MARGNKSAKAKGISLFLARNEKDDREKSYPTRKASAKKRPNTFGDVIASLKSHRDRKLEKELSDLEVRKKNREIEHFLAQRKFFLTKVFTANNQLRFCRFDLPKMEERSKIPLQPQTDTHLDQSSSPHFKECLPEVTDPTTRPSASVSRTSSRPHTSQEKPGRLRNLLFLEEDPDSNSPNRKKILQAEKMLLSHRYKTRLKSNASLFQTDILKLYNDQPLARELTRNTDNRNRGCRETKVRFNENVQARDTECKQADDGDSHCSSSDAAADDNCLEGTKDTAALRAVSRTSGVIITPMRALTLTVDKDKSKCVKSQRVSSRKPATKVKHNGSLNLAKSLSIERQERLIERLMLTVPPKIIESATARAQCVSDMMGHSQKKAILIEMEKEHSRTLGRRDWRFENLIMSLGS